MERGLPMNTALTAYDSLLLEVCPRPIRSKAAYQRALRQVEQLMRMPHLSRAESEMVEMLSLLIEQHEAVENPTPECSPAELLEHLLEARAISKAELARQTGIPRSVITNVLAGRRALSKANAVKLAGYFGVSLNLLIQT
jgi:HTH-type transcriptional regulator/antitoxin HigA